MLFSACLSLMCKAICLQCCILMWWQCTCSIKITGKIITGNLRNNRITSINKIGKEIVKSHITQVKHRINNYQCWQWATSARIMFFFFVDFRRYRTVKWQFFAFIILQKEQITIQRTRHESKDSFRCVIWLLSPVFFRLCKAKKWISKTN